MKERWHQCWYSLEETSNHVGRVGRHAGQILRLQYKQTASSRRCVPRSRTPIRRVDAAGVHVRVSGASDACIVQYMVLGAVHCVAIPGYHHDSTASTVLHNVYLVDAVLPLRVAWQRITEIQYVMATFESLSVAPRDLAVV